MAEENK